MQDHYDVLVIGAGMAGHCAAIAAREAGALVLMIEKCDKAGGSSLMSGATFAFAGTDHQARQAIEDSDDQLRSDLFDAGGNRNDPAMVELYVSHQLETYRWLCDLGVEFSAVELSSNMSRPRSHSALPRQIFDRLEQRTRDDGTPVLFNTRLTGLHRDHSWVAEINVDGEPGEVRASGGIVLATGGFARDTELVARFAPAQSEAIRLGGKGSTGDGIRIGTALGADTADMSFISATFGVPLPHYPDKTIESDGPPPLVHAMYRGAIIVNRDARRFANEARSYKELGDACLRQPGAVGFQIFDQNLMDQSVALPRTHNYQAALEKHYLRTAQTIRDLAATVGLDADTLETTVATYNAAMERGQDPDFGRNTLGKGFGRPPAIQRPPYYILPCTAALFSTFAGLKVDERLQLVSTEGKRMPGLFAAGELIGGFHGKGYMSGTGMGKAAVFGRLAGLNAAAFKP